jgi:hypothetical protein
MSYRYHMPASVAGVVLALPLTMLILSLVAITYNATHPEVCGAAAVKQLPDQVVAHVNSVYYARPVAKRQHDYRLTSRNLPSTWVVGVDSTFLPEYCGFVPAISVGRGPNTPADASHQTPGPMNDTLDLSRRGRPFTEDALCISNDVPTYEVADDGSFRVKATCDRAYSRETWGQHPPVLIEVS